MSRMPPGSVAVDGTLAYDWAQDACAAAACVPATGEEAGDWTVRGWAEVALGCAVSDAPDAFRGLDDAISRSAVPCRGAFADRLRALRIRAGELPACYLDDERGTSACLDSADRMRALDARTAASCVLLAEFCDSLAESVAALRRSRNGREGPPPWANTGDHLRWGERLRPRPPSYPYLVLHTSIEHRLTWRNWLVLPAAIGPRIALVDPLRSAAGPSIRQRVCHGIHNGAHLDHLGALAAEAGTGTWTHLPIEFGSGLLVAESFAMAVELLAAAQCVLAGLPAEARQLAHGFAERIGRIPGYRSWYAREGRGYGSATLDAAAAVGVTEFATLPTLAANYVVGPLRLLASEHYDSRLPAALHTRFLRRWDAVAVRFPAAASLTTGAGRLG